MLVGPPRPMPCGVTKPPTRLLVLLECLPMTRHRPALDSTGTAPDRRQRLPNFNPGSELLPAHQPALCLFTAMQPARRTVAPGHASELRCFSPPAQR